MHIIARFLLKFYSQNGSPMAQKASDLVRKGEWEELQKLTLEKPSSFVSAHEYFLNASAVEIFRKANLPGSSVRKRQNAVDTFWACESQNAKTNLRLARYLQKSHLLEDSKHVAVDDFINRWRKEVSRVLGRVPFFLEPSFSGGSTLSDTGYLTTIPDKMSSMPTCYLSTAGLYEESFKFTPQGENFPSPKIVRGNRFFTVPKDSFKDRGCCVEASANVSLQLAVGKVMKSRYSRYYKVDMSALPDRHRELAKQASMDGLAATIDLSNASDTVAKNLVEILLPPNWFLLLNSLRATHTEIDKKWVRLEKFSSMGNGFTFELETILFQTLCDTIVDGRGNCSVFGDDMIVPTGFAKDCLSALAFFGFSPNDKKTFCEGPFRESCGGDYFNGVSVRAHYIKELPDEPQDWIALANGLRRADSELALCSAAWHFCLDQIPANIRRCRGPAVLGDIVIHDPSARPTLRSYSTPYFEKTVSPLGEIVYKRRESKNSPTHFFRSYRPVSRKIDLSKHFSYRVATAASTLGVESTFASRGQVIGYRLDWTPAYGRNDFFNWIGA